MSFSKRVHIAVAVALLLSVSCAFAQCDLNSNCGDCTNAGNGTVCGWCAESQSCHEGNVTRPDHGTCNSWFFAGNCPNCQSHSYCDGCVAGVACGFCATPDGNQYCLEGGKSGPYTATHQCTTWSTSQNTCPMPQPSTMSPNSVCEDQSGAGNCGQCTGNPDCGFCASTHECLQGTRLGPTNKSKCPLSSWFTNCPDCAYWNSCDACIGGLEGVCGWCQDSVGTSRCYDGNSTGPYRGKCNHWHFKNAANCPAAPAPSAAPMSVCDQWFGTGGCNGCNDYEGCGWCEDTQTCVPGHNNGPATGTCKRWIGQDGSCPACGDQASCEACRVNNQCGWCANNGACYEGNSTGPFSLTCSQGWVTFPDTCQTTAPYLCTEHTSCAGCSYQAGCGWCSEQQACLPGSEIGPQGGFCNSWQWETCPDCNQYTQCDNCLQTSGCGWCGGYNGACFSGNSSGPWDSYCSKDQWSMHSCASGNCISYDHCTSCINNGCGWCMDGSGSCMAGDSSGPGSGSCSNWYDDQCPTGYCAGKQNCASCVASPAGDCGWCTTSKECSSGNSQGPTNGASCSGNWEWYSYDCADATANEQQDRSKKQDTAAAKEEKDVKVTKKVSEFVDRVKKLLSDTKNQNRDKETE